MLATHAATLAQRLAIVQEQNRESTTRIQRLQNELIERNELRIKMESLQSAHAAQRAHLATLRHQLRGTPVHKRELIRNQRAIADLEAMAAEADQLGRGRRSSTAVESPPFELLRSENEALERRISAAAASSSMSWGGGLDCRTTEHQDAHAFWPEADADTLQEALVTKSRAHAAQELALEMKILEARSMSCL